MQDSRRSVKKRERATAWVSSSRAPAKHAPTAFTCAPAESQRPWSTGSRAAVVVHTMSAPRTAAAASSLTSSVMPWRCPCSRAKRSALTRVRLHTRTRRSDRTAAIAAR